MNQFPKVEYVTFETTLPKYGKVKFRSFLVGEHKRLLESISLGDSNAVMNTLADVLRACTFNKIDIDNMEMYILDKLYLDIYVHSRGNINKTNYTCNASVLEGEDVKKCNTSVVVDIPLDRAELIFPDGYTETGIVKISEEAGIKLKQPTIEQFKKLKSNGAYSLSDEFIFACVECIYDGDRIMSPGKDFTLDGLISYIQTFPDIIMEEVKQFFDSTPVLTMSIDIKCPKCGNNDKITLTGLDDFFD